MLHYIIYYVFSYSNNLIPTAILLLNNLLYCRIDIVLQRICIIIYNILQTKILNISDFDCDLNIRYFGPFLNQKYDLVIH